ncbi:hypothetical protein ACFV7R_45845 [Streptomyces sp. NPDC059866]|uniref:hypothetical protein n=1 Tax=Streptomyces sp. NPDC059866 TaxID=3346978 RepID=UPI003661B5BD
MDDRILVRLPEDKTHKGEEQSLVLKDRPDIQLVPRMRRWLGYLAEQGITTGPVFRQVLKNGNVASPATRAKTATKRGSTCGGTSSTSRCSTGSRRPVS